MDNDDDVGRFFLVADMPMVSVGRATPAFLPSALSITCILAAGLPGKLLMALVGVLGMDVGRPEVVADEGGPMDPLRTPERPVVWRRSCLRAAAVDEAAEVGGDEPDVAEEEEEGDALLLLLLKPADWRCDGRDGVRKTCAAGRWGERVKRGGGVGSVKVGSQSAMRCAGEVKLGQ